MDVISWYPPIAYHFLTVDVLSEMNLKSKAFQDNPHIFRKEFGTTTVFFWQTDFGGKSGLYPLGATLCGVNISLVSSFNLLSSYLVESFLCTSIWSSVSGGYCWLRSLLADAPKRKNKETLLKLPPWPSTSLYYISLLSGLGSKVKKLRNPNIQIEKSKYPKTPTLT